jgi:hypothetical protein
MQLLLVRHLWGVDLSAGLSQYIDHWHDVGYEALEASPLFVPDPKLLRKTLQQEGFQWIPQVYSKASSGGEDLRDHLNSIREQIETCLDAAPMLFNAHTGSDSWTAAEAEEFYGMALELEKQIGVSICHETHRSRYFGSPWNTVPILLKYPELKLTCDLSHWVCVAERLLGDCDKILRLAAKHCWHLHARVGYEQGPQVSDPRAPEWGAHLCAHELWWNDIWAAQQARGMRISTLTPEFGPAPYQQTLPYTQQRVSDLNAICDWMSRRQAERFELATSMGRIYATGDLC